MEDVKKKRSERGEKGRQKCNVIKNTNTKHLLIGQKNCIFLSGGGGRWICSLGGIINSSIGFWKGIIPLPPPAPFGPTCLIRTAPPPFLPMFYFYACFFFCRIRKPTTTTTTTATTINIEDDVVSVRPKQEYATIDRTISFPFFLAC